MRRSILRLVLALAVFTTLSASPRPIWAADDVLSQIDIEAIERGLADLADELKPSVVAIHAYEGPISDEGPRIRRNPKSQGSGVIFKSNGYILTNYHVIERSPNVRITLHNGNKYRAAVIQVDERADLAVLKIDAERLMAARFADEADVRVGHIAIAIGNPFGLANFTGRTSFTWGNISTIGRNLSHELDGSDRRYYGELIETSAAINPGNSGGPLFNTDGDLIGIVTAIETSSGVNEGLGFAIPINNRTMKIVETLTRGEDVRYGYLGVGIEDSRSRKTYDIRGKKVRGTSITRIEPNSPAANSVLEVGDIIVEFNGIPVHGRDEFVRIVGAMRVGESVIAKFVRHSTIQATTVRLGDRFVFLNKKDNVLASSGYQLNWRGAKLLEINPTLRKERGLPADAFGLFVDEVTPGTDAYQKNLHDGQIITKINGKPISGVAEFRRALRRGRLVMTLYNQSTVSFDID